MKKLLIAILIASFASCQPAREVQYAKAKITVHKGTVKIQPMEKFRKMPDTTVEVIIIRRNQP